MLRLGYISIILISILLANFSTAHGQSCNNSYQCSNGLLCLESNCSNCPNDEACQQENVLWVCRYNPTFGNLCEHKNLFEFFHWSDVVLPLLLFVASFVASISGLGGGAIFIPLLVLVGNFEPSNASPVSQALILGGSVAVFLFCIRLRHPTLNRPLIDYTLALMLLPPSLVGILGGAIINQILPQWLIVLLSLCALVLLTANTIRKAVTTRRNEIVASKTNENPLELQSSLNSPLIDNDTHSINSDLVTISDESRDSESTRNNISDKPKAKTKTIPWSIFIVILVIVLIAALQALLVGGKGWSPLPIRICSLAYWLATFSLVPLMFIASFLMSFRVAQSRKEKEKSGQVLQPGDIRWSGKMIFLVQFASFLAGFIASLLGLGGGIIYSPLIIELGLLPEVAVATSGFLIVNFKKSVSGLFL
jgi:uncharacterized membrane protein YfcA